MASENIGNLYPSKIPGYEDAADIQAALRLYHYGSTTYDINNANTSALLNPSLAYTLNDLQEQIIDNFNSEKETKLNLIEKNKTKLTDLYNEFNIIIVELENVKANIKKSIVITNEIDIIDIEIKKYETIINQMMLDIDALNEVVNAL